MPNLSIRGLDPSALVALKSVANQEGASVNTMVLRLINRGLGKGPDKSVRRRYDDLDALVGIWSVAEAAEFESVTDGFNNTDPEQWK
jgi:hypothetical protein